MLSRESRARDVYLLDRQTGRGWRARKKGAVVSGEERDVCSSMYKLQRSEVVVVLVFFNGNWQKGSLLYFGCDN